MKYVLAVLLTATVVTARPAYQYTSDELGQVTESRIEWNGLANPSVLDTVITSERLSIMKDGDEVTVTNELDEVVTYTEVISVPITDWYWTAEVALREATEAEVGARIAKADADAVIAAEAEAIRLATPVVLDRPQEMPSIILPSVSNGIGHEYFSDDDGTLLSIVAHASPMKSKAERDALKQQAKARRGAAKARRGAAKTDWKNSAGQGQLQKRIEALEAIVSELLGE